MRRARSPLRVASAVVFAASLVFGPATAAMAAAPTPDPNASPDSGQLVIGEAKAGKSVCTIGNDSLKSVTGLVATSSGFAAITDSSAGSRSNLSLAFLDKKCKTTSTFTNSGIPRDPQDLALGKDGETIWVADFGDEEKDRPRIAIWKVPANHSSQATIYRMGYPDGNRTAEAVLLDANDAPIVLTKDGRIYQPTKKLVANTDDGVPLEKVGDFKPPKTDTENPMAVLGNQITGAAKSPDGTRVVVRTYADAYEFDVAEDGDIVKAITTGTPRITPLPNEDAGSAITYSADGKLFYTVSKLDPAGDGSPKILSYVPYVPAAPEPTGEPAGDAPQAPGGTLSWFDKLSPSDLTRIAAAVGAVGLALAIAGIVGIRRARRRRNEERDDYDDEYDGYDEAPPRRAGEYGAQPPQPRDPRYSDSYDDFDPYAAPAGAAAGQLAAYGPQAGYEQGYDPAGAGYGAQEYAGQGYGAQGYAGQGYDQQAYAQPGYDASGQPYAQPGYDANGQPYAQSGYDESGQAYGGQAGYEQAGYDPAGYAGQQGYPQQGYDPQAYGTPGAQQQAYDPQAYGQQYAADPYAAQGYDNGQGQYAADPYAAQGYDNGQGQYGQQPYGEYDGYDQQHDPRRR